MNHIIYTATVLQRGSCKKKRKLKDPRLKEKEQIFTAFLLCMEAIVNLKLSGEAVRLFMGY